MFNRTQEPQKPKTKFYCGSGYLVWFAAGEEQVRHLDQGNLVPDNLQCSSLIYLQVSGVTQVAEDFLLSGKLPEHLIPPSHFQNLTG